MRLPRSLYVQGRQSCQDKLFSNIGIFFPNPTYHYCKTQLSSDCLFQSDAALVDMASFKPVLQSRAVMAADDGTNHLQVGNVKAQLPECTIQVSLHFRWTLRDGRSLSSGRWDKYSTGKKSESPDRSSAVTLQVGIKVKPSFINVKFSWV